MLNKNIAFILTLFIVGCSLDREVKVKITEYRFDKEKSQDDLNLKIKKGKNQTDYFYQAPGDLEDHFYQILTVFSDTDSVIIIHSDTARLVDKKNFGDEEVKKYFYDVEDLHDEESHVFIIEDKGLIGQVDWAWDGYRIIDHPETDVGRQLKEDNSGFFYNRSNK